MKLSLWDLKPGTNQTITTGWFHHEVIPMGFETCQIFHDLPVRFHHEVIPMGFETLKAAASVEVDADHEVIPMGFETGDKYCNHPKHDIIMKLSLWDLKHLFRCCIFVDHLDHEVIPMGFETPRASL